MSSTGLAAFLEAFFTDRLIAQRRVSPHTVASYRDTFRLLLQFAQKELGKSPSKLAIQDLNAALIGAFLDDLERTRANASRSRNVRLTAIRSFFRYMALECPKHSATIQRVLAIPPKRQSSRLVDFLTRPEIEALLAVPDQTTWLGRRDRALLLFAIQTGLRLSELIGLRQGDIFLERGAHGSVAFQLSPVALEQELRIACNHAKWFLQIVARGKRKLVEILVGALELLFGRFPVGDINARADIAGELTLGTVEWDSSVEDPAVTAIVPS